MFNNYDEFEEWEDEEYMLYDYEKEALKKEAEKKRKKDLDSVIFATTFAASMEEQQKNEQAGNCCFVLLIPLGLGAALLHALQGFM